jgi:hemerythrin-like metal-binding protein
MRVPFMNWISENHSMYLPELDDEHQILFRLGDEVYDIMLAGASLSEAAPKVLEFISKMISHFVHEETLMRSSHYPSRAWHRGQHDVIRAKMAELEHSMQQGDRDAVLPAIDYVSAWLQTHTAVSDRMMGAHLRSHRRSRRYGQVRKPAEPVTGAPSYRRGNR